MPEPALKSTPSTSNEAPSPSSAPAADDLFDGRK
jgi:hypothetical protein